MAIIDLFKRPKYERNKQEVDDLLKDAVIPEHAKPKPEPKTSASTRKPKPVIERNPVVIVPSDKNIFFVENSYKMMENFIINGYSRSGEIRRNMSARFGDEIIVVKGIQSAFKKTSKLIQGQRGSLEIITKTGFYLPDKTELEFSFKPKKRKHKKRTKPKSTRHTQVTPATPVLPTENNAIADEMANELAKAEQEQTRSQQ